MSYLEIITQNLKHLNVSKECTVFGLKLDGKSYLISSHCYLPINHIKINGSIINMDNVLVNSNWNDLIIIKDEYQVKNTFDKIRKTILPNGTRFFIGKAEICYLQDVEYINYAMLPNYPKLMYYKIQGNISNLKPGDPILINNNGTLELVGIISYIYDDFVLGLPSYYIYKTITRERNDIFIPDIENIKKITKIDNYNVVNNFVWNKYIKYNVPIDVNFLLESDIKKLYEIENEITEISYVKYNNNNIITNVNYIMFDGLDFRLTTRLFHLLRELSTDYSKEIIDKITINNKDCPVSTSTSNIRINVEQDNKLVVFI